MLCPLPNDDCDDDNEEDDGDDNNVQGIGPCQPVRPTRDPQETGIDMLPTLLRIVEDSLQANNVANF